MTDRIPKPFVSAHRAGNSRDALLHALEAGADLIETDIWLHRGRLELRHKRTLGPIPILWERWAIEPGWKPRYLLRDLLNDVPGDVIIFLDFKGDDMDLGPAVLQELQQFAPERIVATCGRNYPQLQVIDDSPSIITFYSVGAEQEWPLAQQLIAASTTPALSILASLATQDKIDWVTALGGRVVCWGVERTSEMERLAAMGVDGFTTDSDELIQAIRRQREAS